MSKTFRIGFVLFDNLTQLDFTGPLQVLSRLPGAKVHLVAASLDPVKTDCGPFILPDTVFSECPQLDLICVPGGFGVDAAMEDRVLLDFLREQAWAAKFVSSVCTGAFILGAAGLLQGRKATTHWRYHEHLARFGAIPVKDRVVRDGNLFTGGGVTAGTDFAFTIVRDLAGQGVAEAVQLGLEYDPHPPVLSGSPDLADAAVLKAVEQRFGPRMAEFEALLDRIDLPEPA